MQMRCSTLVLYLMLCALSEAHSQPATDSTPANCKWNLVNTIFNKVSVSGPYYYGKNLVAPTYRQVTYSGEASCQLTQSCLTSDTADLKMYVYYPTPHRYDLSPLPALIFSHAGGFSDCSNYTGSSIDSLCSFFAMRGFVTFKVEYRRGLIKDPNSKYTSVQQLIAMYRSCQDLRGAIRSVVKFQRNHVMLNLPYEIDTIKIFLAGASAGAVMSLNAAYFRNQEMVDSAFPTAPGSAQLKTVLGFVNANFYYGEATITLKEKIKGVLSLWGGVYLPMSYENKKADFFNSADSLDNPPMIGFHGLQDGVFPLSGKAKKRIFFSPAPDTGIINYNSESYCLSSRITLEGNGSTADLANTSGLDMYTMLKKFGRLTEFYQDCEMEHGLNKDCSTCNFKSDFGTGDTNEKSVWLYIAQRATTFFQGVLNKAKPSDFSNSTTLFTDCENKRIQCNYGDKDNNCTNTDICSSTSTDSIMQGISTKENDIKLNLIDIIVYPNPVNDILKLKGIYNAYSIDAFIVDMMGKAVIKGEIINGVFNANLSKLKQGSYYIEVFTGHQKKICLFIKQ
ncbi:hypothetical protein BH10BAC2_BH10BAC2_01520 [soil metagenome]